ncbi:MAG: hypothetical protein ABSG48_01095 [Geobacteraceae bacterium]|jgi:hypothetical protein
MKEFLKEFFTNYVCGKTDCTKGMIDWVALWTFSLAIATLLLVVVTVMLWRMSKYQLGGLTTTAKADFIERFARNFFGEKTRRILMLLDYNALEFHVDDIDIENGGELKPFPYFKIKESIVKRMKIDSQEMESILEKGIYSSFEIDDFLLGYFEEIGSFEQQKRLDIEDVYNNFAWYLDKCWNNPEIKKYVEQQRQTESDDVYENFEYIYNKCNSFESSLNKKRKWF